MEKFYIVTEESSLRKEYLDYKENTKIVNKVVNEFFQKHGIEAPGYYANNSIIMIIPTANDVEKFEKILNREVENGLRPFRENSKINKDWVKTLEEKNLQILTKPILGFEFEVYGKYSTRLFNIDDIVYCSMDAEHDFKTPKGFKEIKASEFYKVIEESKKEVQLC